MMLLGVHEGESLVEDLKYCFNWNQQGQIMQTDFKHPFGKFCVESSPKIIQKIFYSRTPYCHLLSLPPTPKPRPWNLFLAMGVPSHLTPGNSHVAILAM
jgi:hypothetical protein